MPKTFPTGLALILAAALSGCAMPGPQSPAAISAQDISRLEQRQQLLDAELSSLRGEFAELQAQMRSQQAQLQALGGRPGTEIDTRAGQITAHVQPIAPPTPPRAVAPAPSSATDTYLRAFSDYASGRYSQAIAGFERFLESFPDNEYAANAQFWIGECYYAQQDYEQAAAEFLKMAERHAQSGRTPDALFQAASAYQKLGREGQARQIIDLLRQRYPQSAAAQRNLEL
ncbi:tol-pal system protein YbgF [Geoalkalibacter halelectricus]|uniref:Tol-pal system protein YbgF n=1 Tax=Geoalkalibacter halelectricus TaxID=2847045 RepID=A0ABY5ZP68_9BACT|nr:tol-pal system protein YbgF [Geoalkalibacter halelectricus]MDO3378951.1 tol-pal system protein YbgF [Geoalkalibacter halelectricus]UWZ79026.1 tol-pal system protein YbgF [Geoalkalibacter halelectricus]